MQLLYTRLILILILLLTICPLFNGWAQINNATNNIKFKHLSAGLSQSTVTCMLQDRKGFMWFGTRNGLNRYDGVEFTTYENLNEDSTSLSHSYISYLYEDRTGNLWVGTLEGGLNLYDRDTETFTHFRHSKTNPTSLSFNSVTCIYEDAKQNLWIGTENGLNLFLPDKKSFLHYKHEVGKNQSLADDNVGVIFEDNQYNLWVGTKGGGLERFNSAHKTFEHHQYNEADENSISSNIVKVYYKDAKGNIWLGTQNGLNRLVPTKNGVKFVRYQHDKSNPNSLSNNSILSISEDLLGRLWVGTQIGGLSIYNHQQKSFANFLPDPLDPYSISSNSVWSIYRDNAGTMWVGARNRGLDKWDQYQQKFNYYNVSPAGNFTLNNKDITCFLEDELGNLWIGTDGGGLSYLDRKTNQYTHFINDPDNDNSLGSNSVLSLLIDKHKNLWVGTWGGGLNRFNKKTKTFKRYSHNLADPGSISGNNIFSLLEDSAGKLWVGVFFGGLNLYDPATETFSCYNYNPNNSMSLSNNKITRLFEDSKKNLWIGTDGGGLNLMHWAGKDKVTFTHYQYDVNSSGSLSSNIINAITEDHNHNLWVGTWKGLNKFNYQQQTFQVYQKKDGLPDNVINGILEDKQGFLWLSTNQGMSRFDPQTLKSNNYTITDGLQSQEFIRGSHLKTKAGELFFGGINGFNSFFPENIQYKNYTAPLYLTEFRIRNTLIKPGQEESPLSKHISETKKITLNYDQNDFSLGFVALNYAQASQNKYAYKLEGYDKDWQIVGNQRHASYAKVPPGTYTFRVRSKVNNGLWNKEEAFLNIIITPPWWATWWAYGVYALAFIGLLLWYRQNLVKQFKLKSDLKLEHLELTKMQEMERLKSNFFASISHEFRTPLTLILSPLQDMYDGSFKGDIKNQYRVMIRNAERLLRLINQLLDLSKLESGNMHLLASQSDLIDFLKPIFSSFDSYATKKRLKYTFEYPEEPVVVYFDPDKLEKVVTNLLSNAFKFTNTGEIRLLLRVLNQNEDTSAGQQESANYVEISIVDTGIGIPQDCLHYIFDHFYQVAHRIHPGEGAGTGIGLSLTKELIELHKGKIKLESQEGVGSTFKVLLPLGKAHLKETEMEVQESKPETKVLPTTDLEPLSVTETIADSSEPKSKEWELPVLLLVEDNNEMRGYLKERLKRNYYVIEARNGLEGLKMGMDKMPDLIISDVLMPKMNGVDMCRSFKTNVQTSHIPIILLTAQAEIENKIKGLEIGADDYVAKPFNFNELEVRVRNLIKSRAILRERFAHSNKLVLEPKEITITPLDEIFMEKVLESIEKNISDPEYRVEDLGKDVAMSRMPLYRKIKALTGQTAVEFVRTIRLKRAAQLLKQQQLTVSEVTYDVGFNDLQYFRTCFKKQFGVSPSEYAKMNAEVTFHAESQD